MKQKTHILFSGYEWLTRERWGEIHPDKPWNWYDPSCVRVESGILKLSIKNNPRQFTIDGKTFTSAYGMGLISSVDDFSFGKFEVSARLPKGIGLWPAFWMYSVTDWPPEIDIFEGYSGSRNYRNNCIKPYRVETCVHPNIKPKTTWRLRKDPTKYFNKYGAIWTENELVFYLNGKTIRKIKNKEINRILAEHKMQVIINNHIQTSFADKWNMESSFDVEYFNHKSF